MDLRQIRDALMLRRDDECFLRRHEVIDAMLPGKASKLQVTSEPYPKPTQVDGIENTKALERTRVKELGKMVP